MQRKQFNLAMHRIGPLVLDGFVDARFDAKEAVLNAYYRPLGVSISRDPESPWFRQLTAPGLNTLTSVGTPTDAHRPIQTNTITVIFPTLPSSAALGAVPISGWITAGLEWRHMPTRSDGEWQLWWRVSYYIVVRSAKTDYIGSETRYALPQVYQGTEFLIQLS